MIFIFPLFLLISSTFAETEDCPITFACNDTLITKSVVQEFCDEYVGAHMDGRCCNFNRTIVGLDLRYCGINKLNITEPKLLNIECLDLQDNVYDKFTSEELVGLLKLNFLYLPSNIPCPGGTNAWNEASNEHNRTSCYHQLNVCETLNITCGEPENAKCLHTGPGSAKCKCAPNHFGYKCLNEGQFPVAIFTSSIIIPTVILSIILWFVQGRDMYNTEIVQTL